MIFSVDPQNHQPVFLQITDGVLSGILRGVWRAGDQIPSRRELAEELRVNPNTIVAAYHRLEAFGAVEMRRGLGLFVTPDALKLARKHRSDMLNKQLDDLVVAARQAGLDDEDLRGMFEKALKAKRNR